MSSLAESLYNPTSEVSTITSASTTTTPTRFGGKFFQGKCNVNDCVPYWVFIALVCIQVVSIFVFAKTIDSNTGTIRDSSFMEKVKSTLKVLLIDFILGAAIFYFCRSCSNDWAWFVLFLPVILLGLLFFVFVGSVSMLGKADMPPKVVLAEPVK